jgi:succinate dehydrogenase / fumarate reductase iron-sulfur subunit
MAKIDLNVRIRRYSPQTDSRPRWQSFQVSVEDDLTILDVLNEIHWQQDGTLAYRRSCRSAICGSCAMKVNGINVLACETPIHRFHSSKLQIEPLPGFAIIKDLVVDLDPFFDKMRVIKPFMCAEHPLPEKESHQSPEQFEQFREASDCILCGACTSSCPSLWANPDYLGPAALLKAYRFIFDSRDDSTRERLEQINDRNGLWRCHTIFNCMEACPKHIKITEYISKLKVKMAENSF